MGASFRDHRRLWLLHGGLSNMMMGAGLCVTMDASARRAAGEAFWTWAGEGTLGLAVFMAGLGFFEAPSAILFTWTGGEKGPGIEPVVADLCPLNRPALNTFDTLGLSAPLLKSITEMGFETPTDIQAQAIPLLLEGDRDFIGLAQTGTGKTAAFGLRFWTTSIRVGPRASLVLAPTRELGQQIAEQLEKFSQHKKDIRTVAVYGGANIATQIGQLKSPRHVVIATPGRLIDLVKRKAVKLDRIRHLVLDEADEMLNMGFKEELDTILSFTPEDKCTWLFSATMPREIRRMVGQYMTDPLEVKVNQSATVNQNIDHQFALVRHSDKSEAIARFLDLDPDCTGWCFAGRAATPKPCRGFVESGYRADAFTEKCPGPA